MTGAPVEKPQIKDWYEHDHSPSVFVMFAADGRLVWSYSGNELRRVYLEDPEGFLSGPLELPISAELDATLTDRFYENF